MELRHFRLVKAVAEEGNLTNAAKKLFLSQPALSQQLRELEERFGASFFNRANRKMVPTDVARRFLQAAEKILAEMESVETDLKTMVSGNPGILRVATECYTCYHWLPDILRAYGKRYPQVEVRIETEATEEPIQFLLDGKLDVAIASCSASSDNAKYLNFAEIFKDEMVVTTHTSHKIASLKVVHPGQFAEEHLICYDLPNESLNIFRQILTPAGITPKKVSKVKLTEAIVEMVRANLGITVMAKWAVAPYLKSGNLSITPVADNLLERTWYALTMKDRNQLGFVKAFIDSLLSNPIA